MRLRRVFEAVPRSAALMLSLVAGISAPAASAQEANGSGGVASDQSLHLEQVLNADGKGFRRGLEEVGLDVGAGFSAHKIGDTKPHDLVLSKLYYGLMLGDVKGRDRWYQGNWEVTQEVFGGEQYYPSSEYVLGETTALRYNFATGTRWIPYLDAGAGILGTDIGAPDLGTTFEFNEQFGTGVRFFWRRNLALNFQYRYIHISNAGIKEPNQGVNEHVFYAGVTWFF